MQKLHNIKLTLTILLVFGIIVFANPLRANTYPDFSEIAAKYADSVVNISSKQSVKSSDPFNGLNPEDIPDVFRDWYEKNKNSQRPESASSLGSGFVIDFKGKPVDFSGKLQIIR